MGSLLVVTGPPGAGKSTVTSLLAGRAEPSVRVEGDDFFRFLARGALDPWLLEAAAQNEVVTTAAAAATGRYVAGGYEVIYDGVVGPWFLPTFVAAAGVEHLDYVMLVPPVECCLERVAARPGHGFKDEAATRKMHAEFADAAIDSRHRLTDLPEHPEGVVSLIEDARRTGSLALTADDALREVGPPARPGPVTWAVGRGSPLR